MPFWFLIVIETFLDSIEQFISLESSFKIDHRVSELLSDEVFYNVSKLHSNIIMLYNMLFESYRGTNKFINSIWYTESLFIFRIF